MFFFLVSSMRYISELMVSGIGRPMRVLRGELNGFESWLYTCLMTFRHIDRAVMSVFVAKSELSGFVVAFINVMCSACTGNQIYRIFFYCLLMTKAKAQSMDRMESFLFVGYMFFFSNGLGLLRRICLVGLGVTFPHHPGCLIWC